MDVDRRYHDLFLSSGGSTENNRSPQTWKVDPRLI